MRVPSSLALIEVWERGLALGPHRRAAALLEAAFPDRAAGDLHALPLGRRDALLLEFREELFGDRMAGTASCRHCSEQVEVTLGVRSLLALGPPDGTDGATPSLHSLEHEGHVVSFRLPTGADLEAASAAGGVEGARRILVERCVSAAGRVGGPSLRPSELPAGVLEEMGRRMEALDPLASLSFTLACPACRREWRLVLDVVGFIWAELGSWSRRLMRDVHTLASAYGWSEADILSMGPTRRRLYIQMARE
jgi:hypothetical protein